MLIVRHSGLSPLRLVAMLRLVWLLLGIAAPRTLAVSVVNTDTGNYAYTFTDIALQDDTFVTFERANNSLDERSKPSVSADTGFA